MSARVPACSSCGAPVFWTITAKGKRMPVDPGENPKGNVATWRDAKGVFRSRIITAADPLEGWERQRMPHVATCTPKPPPPRPPRPQPKTAGDPHEVIAAACGWTVTDVRARPAKAFRAAARKCHPDVGGRAEDFRAVNDAIEAIRRLAGVR